MTTLPGRSTDIPDVVVIGAGIVGLACAWSALKDGASVTVIDRDFEGDRTSHGNAGGIAVTESTPISVPGLFSKAAQWLLDPLGPLSIDWKHVPRAMPWFIEFQKSYKDRDFVVLGASLDDDGWDSVKPYIEKRKINYRMVIANEDLSGKYGGIENLPTSFVIDRQGRIAAAHVGLVSKSRYENDILNLLEPFPFGALLDETDYAVRSHSTVRQNYVASGFQPFGFIRLKRRDWIKAR